MFVYTRFLYPAYLRHYARTRSQNRQSKFRNHVKSADFGSRPLSMRSSSKSVRTAGRSLSRSKRYIGHSKRALRDLGQLRSIFSILGNNAGVNTVAEHVDDLPTYNEYESYEKVESTNQQQPPSYQSTDTTQTSSIENQRSPDSLPVYTRPGPGITGPTGLPTVPPPSYNEQ